MISQIIINMIISLRLLAGCSPKASVTVVMGRTPEGSTERYMRWCNSLTQEELMSHRFREVTIIQYVLLHRVGSWRRTLTSAVVCRVSCVDRPTWFMSRKTFDKVGGYDETFPGCPEDLIFFYAHLGLGGGLHKVDKV